jgi:hypothetical protein
MPTVHTGGARPGSGDSNADKYQNDDEHEAGAGEHAVAQNTEQPGRASANAQPGHETRQGRGSQCDT